VRLLDRYLLRELLTALGYCLLYFTLLFVAFDLIFDLGKFQDAHMRIGDVAKYYVITLPEILADEVIPISLLLAALYALTTHSRHNELTAMRAAGVSLWRVALPYLAVGICGGVVIFALDELWVPEASDAAKDVLARHKAHASDRNHTGRLEFHDDADHCHWNLADFNKATAQLTSPVISWVAPDGSAHWIVAARGVYTNDAWRFYNLERWDRAAGEQYPLETSNSVADVRLPETPDSIRTEIKVAALTPAEAAKRPQLSIRELLTYLRWHPHLDRERRGPLLTQLQGRVAAPFTCLAVILIALPFGARTGRHNVFVGVAGSIFICFAYFILQKISFGLGVGGYLPPIEAAWLPNAVFGGVGLVLISRMR
jgi:lipopolysaccharide export system permease protein